MAGGIFVNRPFYLNPKCVVFGIGLMVAYWLLPYRNPFLLPILFVTGYILMAWYDYLYNCDMVMYSGTSPLGVATIDAWGKPQRRRELPEAGRDIPLLPDQETAYKMKIYYLHTIFIAPVLAYVAYRGQKANPYVWAVLGAYALLAFAYHGLRFFFPRETTNCPDGDPQERSYLRAVYVLHVLVIAPFLAYFAYYGVRSSPRAFTALGALALLTFFYHGFRIFAPRQTKQCDLKK
jgi:hypothetical protein